MSQIHSFFCFLLYILTGFVPLDRSFSAETGDVSLVVDTPHSYVTKSELFRSGNADP